MITHIIEATNGEQNWGKFLLGRFDATERARPSVVSPTGTPLLRQVGWGDELHLLVLDLQTGEGAMFRVGGYAAADLQKHKVWVCPLFEPFLTWLYAYVTERETLGDRDWWQGLPKHIDLPDAPFALYGHRRTGVTNG